MPAAENRRAQQRAFDRFRREYNEVRPHEALGMQTPAACYTASARTYPARVWEPEYGSALQVRRVQKHGEFYWQHEPVFVSEVLAQERIGLLAVDERWSTVYFAQFPIARFDRQRKQVVPLPAGQSFYVDEAGEGETTPFPCTPSPKAEDVKVSGMCPV